jgi:hypothetical protein
MGTHKPGGLLGLSITEIVIGIVGLLVGVSLFFSADYRFSENEMGLGNLDLAMGVVYVLASLATFVVAWDLWALRSWAWLAALLLTVLFLGLVIFSMVFWEVTYLDLIGVSVYSSVLGSLCLPSTRRLFRRPATSPPSV